jgi:hypothetical protein
MCLVCYFNILSFEMFEFEFFNVKRYKLFWSVLKKLIMFKMILLELGDPKASGQFWIFFSGS